jgi:DNA-binding transcriptional MerR regulator
MAEYRISQVAERTGFSASTLRYYEQAGLLPATARTPGGYRSYDDRVVDRLRFIARAKQFGLPLDEIRELAARWDAGHCEPVQGRLAVLLTGKIHQVRERVAELTAFADQLVAARDGLGRHTPAGACDDTCGCLAPDADDARGEDDAGAGPRALPLLPVVACTLSGPGQRDRASEWADLLTSAVGREPTPDGARIRFPADAALAGRIADLATREADCCRFFDFTLALSVDTVVLRVYAPDTALDLVDAMCGISRPDTAA